MIYFAVLLLILILIVHYDINRKKTYRDFWYVFLLIAFILIAGLRWRLMVDTPNYIAFFYYWTPRLDDYNFTLFKSPFYTLINSIVKTYGGRFYIVQLIEASFVNILIFKYFKRYSKYIFTCLLFYFIGAYAGLSMETMRASFSVVSCLYAYDLFLEKKRLKAYSLIIFALLFHPQTIVIFVLPFLFFLRLNKTGVLFLVGSFILGIILGRTLGDYVDFFEFDEHLADTVSSYAESDRFGGAMESISTIVAQVLSIIYTIAALYLVKKYRSSSNLLKFEAFVMIGLCFAMMRFNFDIAYRYINYFQVYFIIFHSELMMLIIHRAKDIDKFGACLKAFIVFLPFFFIIGTRKYVKRHTLFPYSSVIERKIDDEREYRYSLSGRPSANINEY